MKPSQKEQCISLAPISGEEERQNFTAANVMNSSTNVLLVYRLQEMRDVANLNFWLSVLCLIYCGINTTLFYVNYVNSLVEDEELQPVSDDVFHLVEFWATFGFAVVECVSLANTPKSLLKIYDNPVFLKIILFVNIVATLIPAILVSLNRAKFEILSHEIEYLNELTMSFVDLVLLFSLCRFDFSRLSGQVILVLTTFIASLVAIIQLCVYNLLGRTPDGLDMNGETPAHYCEFGFEIISSLIAFWFCMDNKFIADKEIGLIIYGEHQTCNICDAKSLEFKQTYQENIKMFDLSVPATYGSV